MNGEDRLWRLLTTAWFTLLWIIETVWRRIRGEESIPSRRDWL